MTKLLIIGAGGLGRMVLETALSLKYDCAFLDDNELLKEVCGVKVLGKISTLPNHFDSYKYCICAIGNNALREKYDLIARSIGYKIPNIINKTAYVSPFAKLGTGVILLNNVCVQNGAIVGDGVVITANSEIHHDCEIGDYSLIYSCSVVRTFSKINKKVKIGSNVTICNGTSISANSEIEDGATK